jgi:Domain of unknown function (DU1801)
MRAFQDKAVEAKYDSFAPATRPKLLRLRELAFETAERIDAGPLTESLKWGQPAFSTLGRTGSTFRLDEVKNSGGKYALYFLCQTTLIGTFRELYADRFSFEGNRAVVFARDGNYDEADIAHCMALAVTYGRSFETRPRGRSSG